MWVIVHPDGDGVTGPFETEKEADNYCQAVFSASLQDFIESGDMRFEEIEPLTAEENEMVEHMLANSRSQLYDA